MWVMLRLNYRENALEASDVHIPNAPSLLIDQHTVQSTHTLY